MEVIDTNYTILFEDDSLIVVDKSGNCPVHPGGIRFKNNSLLTQLEKDLNDKRDNDNKHDNNNKHDKYSKIKLYPVYRIDRETSGIVIFSKTKNILDIKIQNKIYLAICKGEIKQTNNKQDTIINKPIVRGNGEFMDWKMIIDKNYKNPKTKDSKTIITPIKSNKKYSLIQAKLITGRRHQIRCHLKSINHEIVGDKIYGESDKIFIDFINNELETPYNKENMNRQALHMYKITVNGKEITSKMPNDMKELLKKIKL